MRRWRMSRGSGSRPAIAGADAGREHLTHLGRHARQSEQPTGAGGPVERLRAEFPVPCRRDCRSAGCRPETSLASDCARASAGCDAANSARMWAQRRLVQKQLDAGGLGQRVARQIVGRRSQAAGRHHQVGPVQRQAENLDVGRQVVGDRRVIEDANAQFSQPLAEPLTVGVQPLAAGQFVADGDDFSYHGHPRPPRNNPGRDGQKSCPPGLANRQNRYIAPPEPRPTMRWGPEVIKIDLPRFSHPPAIAGSIQFAVDASDESESRPVRSQSDWHRAEQRASVANERAR